MGVVCDLRTLFARDYTQEVTSSQGTMVLTSRAEAGLLSQVMNIRAWKAFDVLSRVIDIDLTRPPTSGAIGFALSHLIWGEMCV